MTLVEAVLALMIALLSAVAFFQLFAFGTIELEKLGYRREALELLKGEMEFWRARFQSASIDSPVRTDEAGRRARRTQSPGGIEFQVEPEVSAPLQDRDLRYQELRVRVSYGRGDLADTVEMKTNQYVR
ncbi:MAG TPA: hypothetical protein VJ385_05815 [Fibrobacteria bacterium]|nr:hypothetical protein [Fibrobacteria bacterium]